mmetsp:Transcript_16209/g.52818  ORF Transcript_16209/g.52818 Transcript_16209/m.52818 type:complete len:280 (+) Transcript_16209:2-841(+)
MPSEPQPISFFGAQVNSLKESAPAIGFGTSKRGDAEKHNTNMQSPGPIYNSQFSYKTGGNYSFGTGRGVGKSSAMSRPDSAFSPGPGEYQVRQEVLGQSKTSLFRNAPTYSMGKPGKKGAGRMSASDTSGPGKYYDFGSPLGNQIESTKKNPAAFSFGSAQRFGGVRSDLRRNANGPGPGSYMVPGTTGLSAVESTSRTNPAFRFGSARRFDSPSDTRKLSARGSPGPVYQIRQSTGPQLVSTMRSSQAFGFGSQERFGRASSAVQPGMDSPGPGSYNA